MTNKKKILGQFSTPQYISDWMVKWAVEKSDELLDPAMGSGVFINSATTINRNIKKYAFEIDENLANDFLRNYSAQIDLKATDYLFFNSSKKYASIVCNPPYNKFQQVSNRNTLVKLFKKKYDVRLSGYSNYCIYFLIKAINELKVNGRCAFIMPYEFLNTGYGTVVKEYLKQKEVLKTIIKFDYNNKIFEDAITTSCILLLENTHNDTVDFISVHSPEELTNYQTIEEKITYKYDDLVSSEKWLKYFSSEQSPIFSDNLITFSNIATVKRGIATGKNKFFVISKEKKEELNISDNVCIPCISKSADISGLIFTDKHYNDLYNKNKKVILFDGTKSISTQDYNYIQYGESIKANETYLNSHKNPWYSIDQREVAPIWISVFSRNKLKVVRNTTNTKNLTTFHSVYLKEKYINYTNILFCYLLTPIAQKILKQYKREYGNGLDKFEPNDINNSKILDLRILSAEDVDKINSIYFEISNDKIDDLDAIFRKYL